MMTKRKIYYAEGWSPDGMGYVKLRISKKDIDFYRIRGWKITAKTVNVKTHRKKRKNRR